MDEKDKAMWVHTLWDPLEKIDQSPLHSKKDGIKVAAYCRVSPNFRGVPESLMNQISQYTHMISSKPNWKFIGVYFDNQVTGRKASLRRGFSRMLRHCEEGKIDLILVKSVSRFSRNAKELVEIINRLNELNVTVYFEVENVESTRADSNYLLKTYAAIAQCEVEELSSIIEWGHEKQFIKGVPLLGNLYGIRYGCTAFTTFKPFVKNFILSIILKTRWFFIFFTFVFSNHNSFLDLLPKILLNNWLMVIFD
jgi:DNA invertase Pin-like site-specific DNA recombinase